MVRDSVCRRMTAGKGVLHSEMPATPDGGYVHTLQLWLNLPRKDKLCAVRYQDLNKGVTPVVKLGSGVTVRVISGQAHGTKGPALNHVDTLYLLVSPGLVPRELTAGVCVSG